MTSAAADVIKHNGRKIGRFKPRRFCEVNMHISAWIFVWIQFLTLFKLYMKDKCWCFVYNEIKTLWKSARMTSAQASDGVGSTIEPTSSLAWADVIYADCQTVISHHLQNISTYLFCTAERMLRTIIMENFRLIQACFPIKIDEVWIYRFCVRYDWWRRLQPTSSVSPVWITPCVHLMLWDVKLDFT